MIRAQGRVGVRGRVEWGSTFGVFYCSFLILSRYDVCLLRRQCLISYYSCIFAVINANIALKSKLLSLSVVPI